jgi:hypothetical protein
MDNGYMDNRDMDMKTWIWRYGRNFCANSDGSLEVRKIKNTAGIRGHPKKRTRTLETTQGHGYRNFVYCYGIVITNFDAILREMLTHGTGIQVVENYLNHTKIMTLTYISINIKAVYFVGGSVRTRI